MDLKYWDRVVFIRVCIGKFEKDMIVSYVRIGKIVWLFCF